jgi:conjugative transposon TraJ protein
MKLIFKAAVTAALAMLLPNVAHAQEEMQAFHLVLDRLYDDMIPLCSQLTGVGRGIAAFGALWYIASRVYRQLANAEPIDVYPLLRPFALGMAIMLFPGVMALINGVLQPIVQGTSSMVENSNRSIAVLLEKKEESIQNTVFWSLQGQPITDNARYVGEDEDPEGAWETMKTVMRFTMNAAYFSLKDAVKVWLSEIMHIVYMAASLCINTIRTFYLVVLTILGPLVLGISVFDGFQNSLMVWLARYINVFLWLPIANLFGAIIGKIQENMIQIDIAQLEKYGDTFFSPTDIAYSLFLIIGTIGYFCVPSVASYVVNVAGANTLLHKTNILAVASGNMAGSFVARDQATSSREGTQLFNTVTSGGGSGATSQQANPGSTGQSYQEQRLAGNSQESTNSNNK